jgi:hypothetical protein
METTKLYFNVDRKEISYLRWIVESYDGMAFLMTVDPYEAIIGLEISNGCESLILGLLDSLRRHEKIHITPVESVKDLQGLYWN